ncbi:hypothetical protein ANCDUO_00276 [Ancylostoma duodenale]|uniref:RNA-directed DNA polymerase n=1 Tax=Ancylostoma duodenale TaxID=51022 RepID=A0A0C2HII1_9BILA|nr:hypothetical protein ANCDUO_00276 [Ancylostoma duodenale]
MVTDSRHPMDIGTHHHHVVTCVCCYLTVVSPILIVTCLCYVKYKLLRHVSTSAVQGVVRTLVPRKKNRKRSHSVNVLLRDLEPQPDINRRLFVPHIYAIHSKTSGLPYLKVTPGDITVTAFLESAASISYMRASTIASLSAQPSIIHQNLTASTANESRLDLQGFTKLSVQIGTHTILHHFHIAADKECPAPLLLGSDFIRYLNTAGLMISIDLHNQVISIGSDTLNLVQLDYITLTPTNTYGVRISGDVRLPRRTTNIVPAKIEHLPQPRCKTFLIEDNLRPMDDIYTVGRSLVSPQQDGTCSINIISPSFTDICLPDRMNIDNYPTPKNATDVKSFLGISSFFRRFIYNFANIASPPTALTKKDTPFKWTPECEEALRKLKEALASAPFSRHLD